MCHSRTAGSRSATDLLFVFVFLRRVMPFRLPKRRRQPREARKGVPGYNSSCSFLAREQSQRIERWRPRALRNKMKRHSQRGAGEIAVLRFPSYIIVAYIV